MTPLTPIQALLLQNLGLRVMQRYYSRAAQQEVTVEAKMNELCDILAGRYPTDYFTLLLHGELPEDKKPALVSLGLWQAEGE